MYKYIDILRRTDLHYVSLITYKSLVYQTICDIDIQTVIRLIHTENDLASDFENDFTDIHMNINQIDDNYFSQEQIEFYLHDVYEILHKYVKS